MNIIDIFQNIVNECMIYPLFILVIGDILVCKNYEVKFVLFLTLL